MQYTANPVIVDGHEIAEVGIAALDGTLITLKNGHVAKVSPEMLSRMTPVPGDYYVVQQDGYAYLNPKAVFERKYSPLQEAEKAA